MLLIFTAYFLIGLLFGLYFAIAGCSRIDPSAASAGVVVRVLWIPAAILLWPNLLYRTIWAGKK